MSKGGDKTPPRLGVPGGGRGVDEGRGGEGEGDEMSDVTIRFKRLRLEAIVPTRHTPTDAGMDLYAETDRPLTFMPGGVAPVPTGLAWECPRGWAGLIVGRSSWAVNGVDVLGGLVDCDYRGEIRVVLANNGLRPFTVGHGDRVAQMVIIPVPFVHVVEADELGESDRGEHGFGSSGR